MRNRVCVTVDVEDFYDGMAVLGHYVARPPGPLRGLGSLLQRLEAQPAKPKVTLFVVANYAPAVRDGVGRLRRGRSRDRQSRP